MRKRTKQRSDTDWLKRQKRQNKAQAATGNRCLPEQIRKVLATHYASKYPVR
jgi:hypothetical protein